MSQVRSSIRQLLDTRYPAVINTYRRTRDDWTSLRTKSQRTPYGFQFASPKGVCPLDGEREETALFLSLLDQVDVVVDIGANVGWYSLLARKVGKQVIAVEPLDHNLTYLYRNLLENDFTDVEVYPLALAAHAGVGEIYGGSTGASLLVDWAGCPRSWVNPVALTSMDALLAHRLAGRRCLIKMDAEGGEHGILRGATAVLSGLGSVWMVEICLEEHYASGINPQYAETFDFFFSSGYSAWTASLENSKEVTKRDVDRWIDTRACEHHTHNFLFKRDTIPTNERQ